MAPLTFSFVVRFSSEDAIFKAGNLCNGKADATGAWKCAKEDTNCGSIEAEFQLEKASYISHIDIGNCGSAFIEILVGNSMWPPDKPFVTLLPSATLMNPPECKSWIKTHAVRMFNHNAFYKPALASQWDRIRVICRQPYRQDKQFGLSFMRMGSVPDDAKSPSSSPEGVCGKTSTTTSGQPSDEENDEDGVMRLKKASGLMGCLRGLEKGSPESPLNRAGKMLQAALDSKSPTTPRIKPRNKRSSSQSSPEIASSPESPFGKRNSQSPSEGPNEKKKKKPERKWSLAGDIRDEVSLFLEEIDFTKIDLQNITFKDLRSQMEAQRGCSLTKPEKKVFLQMTRAAIEKAVPAGDDSDDQEDVLELSRNRHHEVSPTVQKTEQPNRTKKQAKERNQTSNSQEKASKGMKQNQFPLPPSTSTVSTPQNKSYSSEKASRIPGHDEIFEVDVPSMCRRDQTSNAQRPLPSTSTVPKPDNKQGHRSAKAPRIPDPDEVFEVEDITSTSSRIPLDDDIDELPSMLYSNENNIPARQEFFYDGDYQPSPIKKKSSESMVECPICSTFFPATEVEFHAALCTGETGATPSVASPPRVATPNVDLIPCPMCSKLFPLAQIEQHADVCVETSICEGSNNIGGEAITI